MNTARHSLTPNSHLLVALEHDAKRLRYEIARLVYEAIKAKRLHCPASVVHAYDTAGSLYFSH